MKNYKYNKQQYTLWTCDGQLYSSLRDRRKQLPAISSVVETLEVMIQKLVPEHCVQ